MKPYKQRSGEFVTLSYLWSKVCKKISGPAIRDSSLEKPSKAEAQSLLIHTQMGRYSYCGYGCTLIHCKIGRFCSIADHVAVGLAKHPMEWVSTSPAFYRGRDSIPKDLAALNYDPAAPLTVIGSDVWIGQGVLIKPGVIIGNGAVIGMGSVVTHDVPSYGVAAGNPSRLIKMRFPPELVKRLEASRWWEMDLSVLKRYAPLMAKPEEFLRALEAEQ